MATRHICLQNEGSKDFLPDFGFLLRLMDMDGNLDLKKCELWRVPICLFGLFDIAQDSGESVINHIFGSVFECRG